MEVENKTFKKYPKTSEKMKEYNKTAYEKEIKKPKIKCEYCGVYYNRYNKYNHIKTKKHKLIVELTNKFKGENKT